jgi:PAS domain S-box-containing protein
MIEKRSATVMKNEEHFSTVFYAIPDPIGIIRLADGRFSAANPSFCSLFGLQQEQVIGHTARELNLWAAPHDYEHMIEAVRGTGQIADGELQYRAPVGKTGFLRVSCQSITLDGEECVLLSGHIISEYKQIENAQQEQLEFLTQVINTMGEGLSVTNIDRQFVSVNPAFANLIGYTPEELLGMRPIDVTSPEDLDTVNKARERRLHGEITRIETRLIHKDGSLVPVLASSSPRMKDGKYTGTISVFTDLTGIKRAEKLRHEWEDRFNKTFRASPIGICIIRLSDDCPVDANQAFLNMTGILREELLNKPVKYSDFLIDPSQLEQWVETLSREGFVHDAETTLRTKTGEICHLLFSIEAFEMEGEALAMLLCVDITIRKQAAAALLAGQTELELRVQERTTELQTANLELETIVRTMAHDLRSPLRTIAGYAYIFEENTAIQLDEDSRNAIQRIKAGARRMGELIDDLMNFLHLRHKPIRKQMVDTDGLVREVWDHLMGTIEKARNVMISIGNLPPCIADPELLYIVFTNLLENALKYTGSCPEARIEVGMQDGAYFVRDNGIGFEPQYGEKIFGIFERLNHTEEFAGTGIGLAIVKRIIERHNGRIWTVSELNRGAIFYFTLG